MKDQTLFPHKTFLHKNAIDIEKLPVDLRKRIYGFEELEGDLNTTLDQDREKLLSRMEDLSHELDEDLEEHFEDLLENNDEQTGQENDEQKDNSSSLPADVSLSHQPEHECACKHAKKEENVLMEEIVDIQAQSENQNKVEEKIEEKELSDEQILSRLHEGGLRKISPEELRKKGFKTPLNFRVLALGRFYLRRPKYDTHYQIIPAWE